MQTLELSRRRFLQTGGTMVVGFAVAGTSILSNISPGLAKSVDGTAVDGFLAIHADGRITLYSGKVDLGTGARAALPQMAAEELDVPFERITMIEGDTALTPDQGPTAGSSGIARGGVQIRQAAATARQHLVRLAAARLKLPESDLAVVDGVVASRSGGPGVSYGELVGDRNFDVKLDPKAPLKALAEYRLVGKSIRRPDIPGKVTGRHVYVHDFTLPGMLHGRVIRPPALGASLTGIDQSSIEGLPGVQIVRIGSFLAVAAEDEWIAIRAARELKASWSAGTGLPEQARLFELIRAVPSIKDETVKNQGDSKAALAAAERRFAATYNWPIQSHASMGPSCAVADVHADEATVWTASQATHKFRPVFAKMLGLPDDKVRLVYLDGSGCYGMNGHDDAAADAALMSKTLGRPVRVQWMREDEHGWDPKGPPQMLDLRGGLDAQGKITAWRPKACPTSRCWRRRRPVSSRRPACRPG
jgi:nicotinate dehydrogenase subunit B